MKTLFGITLLSNTSSYSNHLGADAYPLYHIASLTYKPYDQAHLTALAA